jgi:two-component system sensor histidine kinase BaeS
LIRLTLQRKIYLVAWTLSTLLVVILISLIRFDLGQSFERYTVATELGRLDWLVKKMEAEYEVHGGWDFLQEDPERTWRRLSRPHQNLRPPPPEEIDFSDPMQRPALPSDPPRWSRTAPRDEPPRDAPVDRRPPPNDPLNIGPRLKLVDAEGRWLAGSRESDNLSAMAPILFQGQEVGAVILNPAETAQQTLDDAFLKSQTRRLLWAGLSVLSLGLIVAFLLVRYLLAPIKDLAEGARGIAEGKLNTRIPIRSGDELGDLARHFNQMVERLERLEETRRNWISDASHELRTPLAVLRAEIEALEDGVRQPEATSFARLHKQVQQLAGLVEDLRYTLDQGANETLMEQSLFDPVGVLLEVLEGFEPRYRKASLRIEPVNFVGNPVFIRGDAARLAQVFTNLLENTLRYTDPGGFLSIRISRESLCLNIDFEDTAPAPSRREIPSLFERFFRSEPSRSREYGGAGLGLAICKTLVESHGGEITARLSPLGGLAIHIQLPLPPR